MLNKMIVLIFFCINKRVRTNIFYITETTGQILSNAICLGDVDNDGNSELCIGKTYALKISWNWE